MENIRRLTIGLAVITIATASTTILSMATPGWYGIPGVLFEGLWLRCIQYGDCRALDYIHIRDWFHAVRAFVTMSMILIIFSSVSSLLIIFVSRKIFKQILLVSLAAMSGISGLFLIIAVMIYGIDKKENLHYSYGFAIVSALGSIVVSIYAVLLLRLQLPEKTPKDDALEMKDASHGKQTGKAKNMKLINGAESRQPQTVEKNTEMGLKGGKRQDMRRDIRQESKQRSELLTNIRTERHNSNNADLKQVKPVQQNVGESYMNKGGELQNRNRDGQVFTIKNEKGEKINREQQNMNRDGQQRITNKNGQPQKIMNVSQQQQKSMNVSEQQQKQQQKTLNVSPQQQKTMNVSEQQQTMNVSEQQQTMNASEQQQQIMNASEQQQTMNVSEQQRKSEPKATNNGKYRQNAGTLKYDGNQYMNTDENGKSGNKVQQPERADIDVKPKNNENFPIKQHIIQDQERHLQMCKQNITDTCRDESFRGSGERNGTLNGEKEQRPKSILKNRKLNESYGSNATPDGFTSSSLSNDSFQGSSLSHNSSQKSSVSQSESERSRSSASLSGSNRSRSSQSVSKRSNSKSPSSHAKTKRPSVYGPSVHHPYTTKHYITKPPAVIDFNKKMASVTNSKMKAPLPVKHEPENKQTAPSPSQISSISQNVPIKYIIYTKEERNCKPNCYETDIY